MLLLAFKTNGRKKLLEVNAMLDPWSTGSYVTESAAQELNLGYIYILRLIRSISFSGECDLMVHPRKHIVIFS